jgi:hypothetical protein
MSRKKNPEPQEPHLGPECDAKINFRNIITDNICGAVKGPEDVIVQAVENSFDHNLENKEAEVVIVLDTPRRDIYILDNGSGIEEFARTISLRDTDSPIDKKPGQKRLNDSGLKFSLAIDKETQIATIPRRDPDHVYRFSLSIDYYVDLAEKKGGSSTAQWMKYPLAQDPQKENLLLPYSQGTQILLKEIIPGNFPTVKQLEENLPKRLYLLYADKVFIAERQENGTIGEKHPLKKREMIGDEHRFTLDHPVLGKVLGHFFVPETPQSGDKILLGAIGPICSLEMLVKRAPQIWKDYLPTSEEFPNSVFMSPLITGVIDCAGLNKFGQHFRDQLDTRKFFPSDDQLLPEAQALGELLLTIGPEIEQMIHKVIDRRENAQTKMFVSELNAMSPPEWQRHFVILHPEPGTDDGHQPEQNPSRNKGPHQAIQISPSGEDCEMALGSQKTFRVYRFPEGCSGFFSWRIDPNYCSLNNTQGDITKVQANKATSDASNIKLIVEDAYNQQNGTNFSGQCRIKIFDSTSLHFSTRRQTVYTGERVTLSLRNVPAPGIELKVRSNRKESHPRFVYEENEQKVLVECDEPASIILQATPKGNPTVVAQATVNFKKPIPEKMKNPFLLVYDKPFKVMTMRKKGALNTPVIVGEEMVDLDTGITFTGINIDIENSIFQPPIEKGGKKPSPRRVIEFQKRMALVFVFREYHRLFTPEKDFYSLVDELSKKFGI